MASAMTYVNSNCHMYKQLVFCHQFYDAATYRKLVTLCVIQIQINIDFSQSILMLTLSLATAGKPAVASERDKTGSIVKTSPNY